MKTKISFYGKVFFHTLIACIFIFGGKRSFGYEWSKTFGGIKRDYGSSVQQTTDGGFIIVGSTDSFGAGARDVYLVKTDVNGNEQWSKTFGGITFDYGSSVQQTTDGGFIIVGSTDSFGAGARDVYLVKTDVNGNEQWSKTFGGSSGDRGSSVQQTTDGGFIITGSTDSFGAGFGDVYLVKTDVNGNEQWSKTFGGNSDESGSSVQQTTDGGFIIAGYTFSGLDYTDVYLVKTDVNGNEQWSKTFGGITFDDGSSVQQTTDGGFIITGSTDSFGAGFSDVYLVKTDVNGNEQWSKTFGGIKRDEGYSVQQTADGGFIIAGITDSFGARNIDVYLVKTDVNGNEQWSKIFGGSSLDWGNSVQQTTDGGFIIAGLKYSFGGGGVDVYLIYYSPTPTCDGKQVTIVGTEGHNVINGTEGPDVIHGLGGNDIIQGLGGDDVICGGDGHDVIGAGSGNDTVLGENGHDAIWGGSGNDTLRGGDGNDSIYGGPGNDSLHGNHGNDSLYGRSGVDELYGGWGPNSGSIDNNDTCYDTADTFTKGCEMFYEQ